MLAGMNECVTYQVVCCYWRKILAVAVGKAEYRGESFCNFSSGSVTATAAVFRYSELKFIAVL